MIEFVRENFAHNSTPTTPLQQPHPLSPLFSITMAPSLWVCTALIVAAVVGGSEGGLSEQGAELLSTLAKDKGVRAVALEDNFLYIRELAKGAPDGPTPNITSPCNVSYVVSNDITPLASPHLLPKPIGCSYLLISPAHLPS
jgi:hypothetical protein